LARIHLVFLALYLVKRILMLRRASEEALRTFSRQSRDPAIAGGMMLAAF
jgi:hypothetical protein